MQIAEQAIILLWPRERCEINTLVYMPMSDGQSIVAAVDDDLDSRF